MGSTIAMITEATEMTIGTIFVMNTETRIGTIIERATVTTIAMNFGRISGPVVAVSTEIETVIGIETANAIGKEIASENESETENGSVIEIVDSHIVAMAEATANITLLLQLPVDSVSITTTSHVTIATLFTTETVIVTATVLGGIVQIHYLSMTFVIGIAGIAENTMIVIAESTTETVIRIATASESAKGKENASANAKESAKGS
jgi:hypothetical protein